MVQVESCVSTKCLYHQLNKAKGKNICEPNQPFSTWIHQSSFEQTSLHGVVEIHVLSLNC